jgi:hypothetical protein
MEKNPSKKGGGSAAKEARRKKGGTGLNDLFIAVFGVGFLVSLSLNVLHLNGSIEHSHNTALHQAVVDFKQDSRRHQAGHNGGGKDDSIRLGELNCDAYGGPPKEIAKEMIYWQDIPEDAQWVSPFKHPTETKYLTFEPDGGMNAVIDQLNGFYFPKCTNLISSSSFFTARQEDGTISEWVSLT